MQNVRQSFTASEFVQNACYHSSTERERADQITAVSKGSEEQAKQI